MDKKIVKIMTLRFTEIVESEEDSSVHLADRNSTDSSGHSHSHEGVSIDEENAINNDGAEGFNLSPAPLRRRNSSIVGVADL